MAETGFVGVITSGDFEFASGSLFSGVISSGQVRIQSSGEIPPPPCARCGKSTPEKVTVRAIGWLSRGYCYECAGYSPQSGFQQRLDWIKDSIPFSSGTPIPVVTDWLEENWRKKDSDYLKMVCSGMELLQ